jgi:hypothetical protein
LTVPPANDAASICIRIAPADYTSEGADPKALDTVGVVLLRVAPADTLDPGTAGFGRARSAALAEHAYAATFATKPKNPWAASLRTLPALTPHPSGRRWISIRGAFSGIAAIARDPPTDPAAIALDAYAGAAGRGRRQLPLGTGAFDACIDAADIQANPNSG